MSEYAALRKNKGPKTLSVLLVLLILLELCSVAVLTSRVINYSTDKGNYTISLTSGSNVRIGSDEAVIGSMGVRLDEGLSRAAAEHVETSARSRRADDSLIELEAESTRQTLDDSIIERSHVSAELARVYPFIVLVDREGLATGFSSVSSTQLAAGSPEMTGMLRPRPGRAMRRARRITALLSCVFCMISLLMSVGRVMLVRLVEMPLILFSS